MKYANEPLADSSDTKESEGYRLTDVKNLSTAVSNGHVCEMGEEFFEVYGRSLSSIMTYFPYRIGPWFHFSLLNFADLSIKSWIRHKKDF